MSKRVIIVRRTCHEFANKLWSDMAIYAYAFMVKAKVLNLAVFETGPLAPVHTFVAHIFGLRGAPAQYTFLPPTTPLQGKFTQHNNLYFFGWLFRNPEGFNRYRTELLERFGPSLNEEAHLQKKMAHISQGRTLIGVHIRLNPFPYFPNGEFLIPPERVREIVVEYLHEHRLSSDQVALVLVTDQPASDLFRDFTICTTGPNERTNFFLLSKCSVIIGTNTTFCNLAAWFGDVAHIVTTRMPIDWEYYKSQGRYFENKYATFTFGNPGQE